MHGPGCSTHLDRRGRISAHFSELKVQFLRRLKLDGLFHPALRAGYGVSERETNDRYA